jgi:AraC-like DNA-binding protein
VLLDPPAFRRLCEARAWLGAGDAPIREVARAAGISQFHFIRRFAQVFGATPHELRSRDRIARARELLARGELSVTEVCFELGYASLGSFSARFLARVGEAPSRYRRRVRALVSVPGQLPVAAFPGCFSLMAHLPAGAFRNSREAGGGAALAQSAS